MSFYLFPVAEASVVTLMKSIDRVVINPIILFLFALAMVYFLYGLVQYLLSPGNEEVHKKSKSVMIWGVVGLFIMISVFGIMKLILSTFGENRIKLNNNGDYVVEKVTTDNNGNSTVIDTGIIPDRIGKNPTTGDLFNQDENPQDTISTLKVLPGMFTTSPFPKYKSNSSLCWNTAIYSQGSTDKSALELVKDNARKQYLLANGVLDTDINKKNYPIIFATKVLYNENTKMYYAWIDIRAPLKNGTVASNCTLEILSPAPVLPDSIIFYDNLTTAYELNQLGGDSIGAPVGNNNIVSFTTSPFLNKYESSPLCWRKEIYVSSSSEYQALQDIKVKVRTQYLKDNSLIESSAPKNLPIQYGVLSAYDKIKKLYYVWWDARAPIKTGTASDCNLSVIASNEVLPQPVSQSNKNNPLTANYISDNKYYRAIGSGVDSDYSTARNIAINNALIEIARLKGLASTSSVIYKTILEEKYYQKDVSTGKYDYWVAIESLR